MASYPTKQHLCVLSQSVTGVRWREENVKPNSITGSLGATWEFNSTKFSLTERKNSRISPVFVKWFLVTLFDIERRSCHYYTAVLAGTLTRSQGKPIPKWIIKKNEQILQLSCENSASSMRWYPLCSHLVVGFFFQNNHPFVTLLTFKISFQSWRIQWFCGAALQCKKLTLSHVSLSSLFPQHMSRDLPGRE